MMVLVHIRRLLLLALLGALLWVLPHTPLGAHSPDSDDSDDDRWLQVSEPAFGLSSGGSYQNEEAYEVAIFRDQLYLGMEADNSLGARLWRSRQGVSAPQTQADWEEVAADTEALPFGHSPVVQNDHIDSLATFQDMLYVSTANGGSTLSGTLVYRSPSGDPLSWTRVITSGFGDSNNTNFKDMQVFDQHLCGGTQNQATGAQVWCTSNGTTWQQVNRSGFGDTNNYFIWSSHVFQDALYIAVIHRDEFFDTGRLYRTTSLSDTLAWSEVYSGAQVELLGDFREHLYIATRTPAGVIIQRSASGDAGSWQRVSNVGMDGSTANRSVLSDGAAVYREALYIAVSNEESGFQVWRTTGTEQDTLLVDWEQMGRDGLGDPDNVHAQLVAFNDYLYAWTTNYTTGQQVRRGSFAPAVRKSFLPLVLIAKDIQVVSSRY
jgi:hypothetical protein